MILSLAAINWLANKEIFELYWLFDGIRTDPLSPDYWWLYVICFSTLLPTLIHFFIAAMAGILIVPQTW